MEQAFGSWFFEFRCCRTSDCAGEHRLFKYLWAVIRCVESKDPREKMIFILLSGRGTKLEE